MTTIATILFAVTLAAFLMLMFIGAVRRRRPSFRIMAILAVVNLCSQIFLLVNGKTTCTLIWAIVDFAAGILLLAMQFADKEPYEPDDEDPDELCIRANPVGQEEIIEIRLDPEKYPIAFKNKVDELVRNNEFADKADTERYVERNPIVLELYYEKGAGLFAVESEAVEAEAACSPYTRRPIICDEEDD